MTRCGIGSFPAADFAGDDYLEIAGTFRDFTQGMSAFVVARAGTPGNYQRFFELGQGPWNHNIVFSRFESTSAMFSSVYLPTGTPGEFAGWVMTSPLGAIVEGEPHIYYMEFAGGAAGANTSGAHRRDGAVVFSGNIRVPELFDRGINYIGRSNWHTMEDEDYVGQIAEVVLFQERLTDPDRETVELYLSTKFDIAL